MAGAVKDIPGKNALIALTDTEIQGEDSVRSEEGKLKLIGQILEEQLYLSLIHI